MGGGCDDNIDRWVVAVMIIVTDCCGCDDNSDRYAILIFNHIFDCDS